MKGVETMMIRRDKKFSTTPEPTPSRGVLSNEALAEIRFNVNGVQLDSYRLVSELASSPSAPSYTSEVTTHSKDKNDAQTPQSLLEIQKAILSRSCSRFGREQQRFVSDPETGVLFRLTAGSVPIMPDGKIFLVSSSRGDGWILPKG